MVRHKFTTFPCYDATNTNHEVKERGVGDENSKQHSAKGVRPRGSREK